MPYVEGETLRQRLRREPRLPVDDALRIAGDVAHALDYAHGQGLVHRDIKPENILLTTQGDSLVADFGIGRALAGGVEELQEGASQELLTGAGALVGTPAYMSLEQIDAEPELDGRADIYSLGVVLYEMLAGTLPFAGSNPGAIVARQLTGPPRPLRLAREEVSPDLEGVVIRMLARDPQDRFATAGEVANALEGVGRSGAAPQAPAIRLRRGRIAGVLATLGALAALGAGLTMRRAAAPVPELRASVVAVAPFDVFDPKLELWREGLVDLLSRNLDGAGPLRAVPPTVVVRRWTGRADSPSAAELGRRTGAGLALFGSLLGAGPDSARIRATLLDVTHDRALGEWEVVDAVDRMDRLVDSLTLRVLGGLGRTRPIGAVRLAGFGATSLPALKAFLQGEQHHRRSEWDSALSWYQRAIELDSSFAPAFRRLGTTIAWMDTGFDSLGNAYVFHAGANNHGLPARTACSSPRSPCSPPCWKRDPSPSGPTRGGRRGAGAFSPPWSSPRPAIPTIRRRGSSWGMRTTTWVHSRAARTNSSSRHLIGPSRSIPPSRPPTSTHCRSRRCSVRWPCAATCGPIWRSRRTTPMGRPPA